VEQAVYAGRVVDRHLDPGFGRDGLSGLVNPSRAVRARDVSRPGPEDRAAAEAALPRLLARAAGRRAESSPSP